jgi:hypothetical protein
MEDSFQGADATDSLEQIARYLSGQRTHKGSGREMYKNLTFFEIFLVAPYCIRLGK